MNQIKHPFLLLFTLASFFSINTNAQLVINEFSAANYENLSDNFGNDKVDWIEIYNMGSIPLDLSGYHMTDNDDNLDKFIFPAGITIGAGAYRIIYATGNDSYDGTNIHADFKLRQTDNEWIILSDPNLNILDAYQINSPNQKNHSWARSTDGTGDFAISTNPTPNGPNGPTFVSYVPKPTIEPVSGFYTGSVTVTLGNDNPGATIYYTTDGSDPSDADVLYTGPFTLSATTIIRTRAYDTDATVLPSHQNYHTYFVDEVHTLPVVSISGDDLLDLMNGTQNTPEGTFEMFDETGDRVADCTGEFNKHGNDSWAYDQRGIDYITRDQFGDDYAIKYQLFDENISDRTRFQRVILKAAANDNYPFEDGAHIRDSYVHTLSQRAGMEMDERTHRSCVMYVNGEYWGVYDIREKVDDHDFTEYYYDQGRDDIDYIKTWGGTWAEYGSKDDWDALVDYILNNDMTDPVHYNYVDTELNMLSLVDYMILHAHIVSSDWLNWNTSWWRGRDPDGGALKWQYSLWDEDATFGHYINYTDIPDQSPLADPCNPEILGNPGGEGHVPILNALLENEDFFQLYINRYADLNNLYFNCDYMLPLLDEMTGLIAPEMARQVDRWGGTVAGWEENVMEMRDFIEERCAIIDTAIVDCYEDEGLSGPWEMIIEVDPPGGGFVQANTTVGINYPWITTYFGGIGVGLTAIPEEDWLFVNWEVSNNTYTPGPLSPAIGFTLDTLEMVIAHFEPGPCLGVWVDPGLPDQMYRCTGSTLTLQAATGPGYTYEWSTGETTSSIIVDDNDDYSVTVYNSAGCDGYVEIDVDEVDFLVPNIQGSEVFCTGFSTTLDAGDVYTDYLWSTGATTPTIDVNVAGTYTVMVTDMSGCTGEAEIIIEETDGLDTEITGSLAICEGTPGTLTATGNYSGYAWSSGEDTESITINNAGIYTVTVSDGSGCTGEDQVVVSSGTVSMTSETVQLCYGGEFQGSQYFQSAIVEDTYDGYNGCDSIHTATINVFGELLIDFGTTDDCVSGGATIVATPVGGSSNYTYLWSTGETTQQITQNPQGTYSVTVTDSFGCTSTNDVFVDPAEGVSLDYEVDAVSCFGDTNGHIDLSIITAAEPYTTTWSNGETTEDLYDLPPGDYTLLVTDANDCNFGITITVDEPELLQPNLSSTPVFDMDDGSVSAQPTGGTAPYSYQWYLGYQTATVTDLEVGFYTVTITDANGCTVEGTVEVGLPVAVSDIEELLSFDIRPNPSSGLFQVMMEFDQAIETEVKIFNLLGQNIASFTPDRSQHVNLPIDIRGVADGTYILVVEIGEKRLARKVVITN